MITFDAAMLTSYYNSKAGIATTSSSGASGSSGGTGSTKTASPTGSAIAPKSPWAVGSTAPQESDLVKKVLAGHRFIDPNAITSNVTGSSPDYTKLFTMYQGLSALEGLAAKAQDTHISANALAEAKRRFTAGMKEVQEFIQGTKFDHVSLTEGTLTKELKNTVGVAKTDVTYTGPSITSGSATASVKAFEGDVQFAVSVKKTGTATPFTVNIDLSEMGTTTRSMSNVVSFINGKFKEQGLGTKFVVNRTPAVPETVTVGGKTVTTSKGVDTYGLQIKGQTTEILTFSAPSTADSVYVVQTTGDPDKKATTPVSAKPKTDEQAAAEAAAKKPTVTSQLIKFQTDVTATGSPLTDPSSKPGDKYWVAGEADQTQLQDSIKTVRQTAAGPDGSVYVLADVDSQVSGQDIKGTQDVALIKYDSAGKVVFTRTLGAADAASGYTMAVGSDGKVAIAGSVTGALDVSETTTKVIGTGTKAISSTTTTNLSVNGKDASTSDSFVSVFDASGVEQWTQRRGAAGADEATAVAFGDDGSVYVGGRTMTTMPGAGSSNGGWDSYVMGFGPDGKAQFTTQGGTAQSDSVSGIVVSGNTLYTSGIENGNAVVKTFNLASGPVTTTKTDVNGVTTSTTSTVYTATQTGSRDLGGIGGGSISGMQLYNGKIYLGGSSGSDKLIKDTAHTTNQYSSSYDAFALSIDANLGNVAGDTIAYYGGEGVEKDAKVQFSNGKAWISGQTTGDINGTTKIGKKDAYLTRIDLASGAVEYQTRYSGADGMVQPNAITISKGGSSVLDKLGLPQGTIQYTDSNKIVSGTSVRTGDQFYMVDPSTGMKKTITIDANETLDTLAKKIARASSYKLKVEVTKVLGKQQSQLDIKPANSSSKMEFVAGPLGRDALAGLGLDAGVVSNDAGKSMDASSSGYLKSQKAMGLNFDDSLNLNSDANIKEAIDSLKLTIKNVQKVYNYLKYGDPQNDAAAKKGNTSGVAPAYLTNQIANYTAALNRLTAGS